jgi:hypothetical protein
MLALRQLKAVTDVFYLIRTIPKHAGAWRGCSPEILKMELKHKKANELGQKHSMSFPTPPRGWHAEKARGGGK